MPLDMRWLVNDSKLMSTKTKLTMKPTAGKVTGKSNCKQKCNGKCNQTVLEWNGKKPKKKQKKAKIRTSNANKIKVNTIEQGINHKVMMPQVLQ